MTTRSFVDQLGKEITFPFPPRSIVSLVPSQTEVLYHLGLEREITGITKFCVRPGNWLKSKTIIGGTKKFLFDTIERLNPDLIIGNKEENYKEGIERLRTSFPVWMSDIVTLADATDMISSVGALTDKGHQAAQITASIHKAFEGLKKHGGQSVLYLIWKKPWMAAGGGTFIDSMLRQAGFRNIVTRTRYPELDEDGIRSLRPDYIFLSTEPFPFREEHIGELIKLSPASKIILVDGEMFSWYGSRLLYAPAYFNSIIPA